MPARKLKEFLDSQGVTYVTIPHPQAITAQEIAASAHIPGREMAKTVMVLVDGRMAMAVLPAYSRLDLEALREAAGAEKVEIAGEEEFKELFPDCEPGAMPPFGNLYGMHVFLAESLAEDDEIAFNAGTHTELIRIPYADFARLVHPKIAKLAPDDQRRAA